MKALLLIAAFLTMKEALDLHCKLTCEDDGEISGRWNEKEKQCECSYIRYPALKVDAVLKKELPED